MPLQDAETQKQGTSRLKKQKDLEYTVQNSQDPKPSPRAYSTGILLAKDSFLSRQEPPTTQP